MSLFTGVDVSWIYPLSYQTGTRALIFPPPLYLSLTDIPRQVTTRAVLSHRVPLSLPSLVFNLLPPLQRLCDLPLCESEIRLTSDQMECLSVDQPQCAA